MLKVAVLGATGFTGEKLVELLLNHRQIEIAYLASRTKEPVDYGALFPRFYKKINLACQPLNIEIAANMADIFFLSLPHTVSMQFAPYLLSKGKKVIDLSADYRLKDLELYKKYYKVDHLDKDSLETAVYGLAELYQEDIAKANLIANAGCYPSASLIAIYPLVKEKLIKGPIIVDAKSSITGAGRKADVSYHYSNIADNIWAYKPFNHQHVPEITEVIKDKTKTTIDFRFVPQVIGVEAGIYATIHVSLEANITEEKIFAAYDKYYSKSPFVRIFKQLPALKNVVNTNYCDLGVAVDKDKNCAVIASCIDNLIKGAAGGAIQNMNIMLGLKETEGLV